MPTVPPKSKILVTTMNLHLAQASFYLVVNQSNALGSFGSVQPPKESFLGGMLGTRAWGGAEMRAL